MIGERFDTRPVLRITVVRVKLVEDELHMSCALPCIHCRGALTSFAKYRYKKHGQVVKLRYSTEDGGLSPFLKISELPPSSMSSGYRAIRRKKNSS